MFWPGVRPRVLHTTVHLSGRLKESRMKNKITLVVSLFVFALTACLATPAQAPTARPSVPIHVATAQPYPTLTASAIPSLSAGNNVTPTMNATASPTEPFSEPVTPPLVAYCPENQITTLSELGLGNTMRLMLVNTSSYDLWSMSGEQSQPVKVSNIPLTADVSSRIWVSPNGQWFVYEGNHYETANGVQLDYWISDVEGSQQWLLAPGVAPGVYPVWVNNDKVEFRSFGRPTECAQRELAINPFTMETQTLPPLPALRSSQYCAWPGWIFSPDEAQVIYPTSGDPTSGTWVIYDFRSGESKAILPWISDVELEHPLDFDVKWSQNGLGFIFLHQGSFETYLNLSASLLDASDLESEKFLLPGEVSYNNWRWWSKNSELYSFDLVDKSINQLDYVLAGDPIPSRFFVFDISERILRDYCLDRGALDGIDGRAGPIFASSDDRYLAWGIYEPPNARWFALGLAILDLETGRVAMLKLPGYDILGWGAVPSSPFVP